LDPDSGKITFLADPESHLPENRFNDGKCDPFGRFWAGTMALDFTKGAGSMYCLFPDLSAKKMAGDLTISNGLAWSLDQKTMYLIDSADATVWAFDYDPKTAAIQNKRALIVFQKKDGSPDGMTMDSEGKLWIAHWDGARVTRWDPENGKLLFTQPIPASLVTSVAFGGPGLDEMYVTTARVSLSEETLASQPHAGGLFRFKPGVKGLPAPEFAG
jgi:sugar lactone lactonase YvrE